MPLENNDLEQRIEKKLNDVYNFKNSINMVKEMLTYFKNKNHKPKKNYQNYKTLISILESVDTVVFISATTTSVILSVTGIGLIVVPIPAGIACALSLGNKLIHRISKNTYNK